jgi:hypothetical protein
MSTFGGSVPYDVISPYEALLAALDDTAARANCGFVKYSKSLLPFFEQQADGAVAFRCHIHLQEWRARGSSRRERIHMLIHAEETFRRARPTSILLKSTVRVSYFAIEENRTRVLQTVHYDYGPVQPLHPEFHAQLSSEVVQLSAQDATELEFPYHPNPAHDVCKSARIPTSDMTLPSVLLCLAADHIEAGFFPEFLHCVRDLQDKLPQPPDGTTRQSILASPRNLRSSHWFAHTS